MPLAIADATIGRARSSDVLRASDRAGAQTFFTRLPDFGLLQVSGADSAIVLNGQLSTNVLSLGPTDVQFSSCSNAKGRLLATVRLWRTPEGFTVQLPVELSATVAAHLRRYVLRADVAIREPIDALCLIGVAGPNAAEALAECVADPPAADQQIVQMQQETLSLMRFSEDRYQLVVPIARVPQLLERLSGYAIPAAPSVWARREIQAGIPWITAATQQEFVAQMVNLDLIGGIAFDKGCYTGQEIIARTHYLGKLKRRMYRLRLSLTMTDGTAARAGDALYSADLLDQASGTIVNVAPAEEEDAVDALAVVYCHSLPLGVHLHRLDGPRATVLPLPYTIPDRPL